jgi:hypothetical protein
MIMPLPGRLGSPGAIRSSPSTTASGSRATSGTERPCTRPSYAMRCSSKSYLERPSGSVPATSAPTWCCSARATTSPCQPPQGPEAAGHRGSPGLLPGRRRGGPAGRAVPPQRPEHRLRPDRPGAARHGGGLAACGAGALTLDLLRERGQDIRTELVTMLCRSMRARNGWPTSPPAGGAPSRRCCASRWTDCRRSCDRARTGRTRQRVTARNRSTVGRRAHFENVLLAHRQCGNGPTAPGELARQHGRHVVRRAVEHPTGPDFIARGPNWTGSRCQERPAC